MKFFHRAETTLRCLSRSNYLSAPDAQRLLKSCPEPQRARLSRRLSRLGADDRLWSVEWHKAPGESLRPQDVVTVLRLREIVVELAVARHGVLAERLVSEGAEAGARLARIDKPAIPTSRSQRLRDLLTQFTTRHHLDIEQIKTLQAQLTENEKLVGQLRAEILMLRAHRNAEHLGGRRSSLSADRKFRRLKLEFSKRFHPDSQSPDPAERRRRELVFQEFWPILEQIERS